MERERYASLNPKHLYSNPKHRGVQKLVTFRQQAHSARDNSWVKGKKEKGKSRKKTQFTIFFYFLKFDNLRTDCYSYYKFLGCNKQENY